MVQTTTLETTENHLGSEPRTNPDKVNQVINKENKSGTLTLYIPSNFDIDKLVKDNPPTFKYHRDKFIYLAQLINDLPSRKKTDKVLVDYVPFYSKLIQRRVRDYRKHLDYLVEQGVFEENKQYIVGKKSRSFRFSESFDTIIKPTVITKPTLIKSILKFIDLDDDVCSLYQTAEKDELYYLTKWFNGKLTVDMNGAKKYLEGLRQQELDQFLFKYDAMRRFNSRYIVLLKIERGEFAHTIDKTARRLHTVLTQLKSELRQFIQYNGKPLIAIDITNSQPYLSTILFNYEKFRENNISSLITLYNNTYNTTDIFNSQLYYVSKNVKNAKDSASVNKYIEMVKSGRLYEEFGKILVERNLLTDSLLLRKEAKTIIFSSIFSPNQAIAYNEEMKIFKEVFPDVYEIYRGVKQNEHRTLACLLQNLEAKLVLENACKFITEEHPEIPLFTLHDSIITTEGNEEYVYNVLYEVLLKAIGIPPTLKYERWEKVA